MPWSPSQQKRLAMEKSVLESYFGGRVSWINPTGDTKVEVRMTCSNDKRYTLRVYLPADFPSSCPTMIVSNPSTFLKKRNGDIMNDGDGAYHTNGSKDGCTVICHFNPGLWRGDNTLYQIFMKGLILAGGLRSAPTHWTSAK